MFSSSDWSQMLLISQASGLRCYSQDSGLQSPGAQFLHGVGPTYSRLQCEWAFWLNWKDHIVLWTAPGRGSVDEALLPTNCCQSSFDIG